MYEDYIMRNAELDEAQPRIKIAGRNINNLRYADDTTLMAESKKELNEPDNHSGVITHLEPDILECEVKWALGSMTTNKASRGDGIPVELFQIIKDDAVIVLQKCWLKHELESRLLGEISITSDMQMTPPIWQKVKKN